MDRTSLKVLRDIKKQGEPVSREIILKKYGTEGEQSLSQLNAEKYISQGFKSVGVTKNPDTGRMEPRNIPNGMYVIAPKGRGFLAHKFWNDIDKWITRSAALVGLVTGIISLIMHFV